MSQAIRDVFAKKTDGKPVFVAFVTAGFPTKEETVSILLGLEKGGADIIELGVPHSGMFKWSPSKYSFHFLRIRSFSTFRLKLM